eukprot:2352612-Amphidinium_carterae.1
MAHDVQDLVYDAGHRDILHHPSAERNEIPTPPCDQHGSIILAAATAHPVFTAEQTTHLTQHSTSAEHISRTLVHASADEENNFEDDGCPTPLVLDSQLQTTQ